MTYYLKNCGIWECIFKLLTLNFLWSLESVWWKIYQTSWLSTNQWNNDNFKSCILNALHAHCLWVLWCIYSSCPWNIQLDGQIGQIHAYGTLVNSSLQVEINAKWVHTWAVQRKPWDLEGIKNTLPDSTLDELITLCCYTIDFYLYK